MTTTPTTTTTISKSEILRKMFEDGRQAFRDGETIQDNPQAKASEYWYAWNRGFLQSKQDDEFAGK